MTIATDMEHGNAIKQLQDRGYRIEWSSDRTRVMGVTNRAGDTLKQPSPEELVQLATGMPITSVREARTSD